MLQQDFLCYSSLSFDGLLISMNRVVKLPQEKKKKEIKIQKIHPKHKFSFTSLYTLLTSNMKKIIQILKNCLKINLFGNKNAY